MTATVSILLDGQRLQQLAELGQFDDIRKMIEGQRHREMQYELYLKWMSVKENREQLASWRAHTNQLEKQHLSSMEQHVEKASQPWVKDETIQKFVSDDTMSKLGCLP